MTDSLEHAYRAHHQGRSREGFSILEDERGALFARIIGTGKRVLDLGCRDGTLTRHIAAGNEVVGADVDSHALASAAATLNIQTVQFDFNAPEWPLEPASFDVVLVAEVLEHLFFPDRVLRRIERLLKPGGMLVGSVPNAFSLKCRLRYLNGSKRGTPLADPMHINQFGWDEFGRLCSGVFDSVQLYPLGRWQRLSRLSPSLFAFGIGFSAVRRSASL
ncbi:MAG: class I SAM-dependent methyltransferase [Candidatus Yanofskybacteria bacterium]|nr:class I SAM-dependent methyltransferase [Candidatus Yanofskybacteria bacterium]